MAARTSIIVLVATSACYTGLPADGAAGGDTAADGGSLDDGLHATTTGPGVTSHASTPAALVAEGTGAGGDSSGGPPPAAPVVFAVIGDYGTGGSDEAEVAALVAGWDVDFVITLGDNNYPDGKADTIDDHIGQFYAPYIGGYRGAYGPGSAVNRFWPAPGNHDWHAPDLAPYLDYFTLPGNERYYDVDLGLVHLWALDSDPHEPDGVDAESVQAQWLARGLGGSQACYDVVYFHHAGYSSSEHGSSEYMQWPFEEWGAEVVMAGHDHSYERLQVGLLPYFVNGLGGASRYEFGDALPETLERWADGVGAMRVTATSEEITYEFIATDGTSIDRLVTPAHCD